MRTPSTLKILYAPYLRIQLPGAVCGGLIRIQLLSEVYAEAGYAYNSDLSCMRTELYAYLQSIHTWTIDTQKG